MAKFRSILPPINEEQIKLSRLLPRVVSPSSFFPSVEIVRSVFPLDVHMCAIFHPVEYHEDEKKRKKEKRKKDTSGRDIRAKLVFELSRIAITHTQAGQLFSIPCFSTQLQCYRTMERTIIFSAFTIIY